MLADYVAIKREIETAKRKEGKIRKTLRRMLEEGISFVEKT